MTDAVAGTPESVVPDNGSRRAAAFFDLDRTLIAGSSGLHWARAARRVGMVNRRDMAKLGYENLKFRLQGSTDESTIRVRKQVSDVLDGAHARDLSRMAPQVVAGVLPRVYPQVLDVAYEHQDAGRPVYICTAASQELADLLAHVLGFDGAIGARYELRADGSYTGAVIEPFTYREGKAIRMGQQAEIDGLDLQASYAYSDSESDLPMLRIVGHPVAVNPDAELSRIAEAEGWQIMRFEQLGRKLKAGAALAGLAVLGGVGRRAASRRAATVAPPPASPRRRAHRFGSGSGRR
jgi:HAD superfamily hydrolase (TIGR01490 family)